MTDCDKCLHRRVKVVLGVRTVDCAKHLALYPAEPCPRYEPTMVSNMKRGEG